MDSQAVCLILFHRIFTDDSLISNWAQRDDWKQLQKEIHEKNDSRSSMPSCETKHHHKKRRNTPIGCFGCAPMMNVSIFVDDFSPFG